MAGRIDASPSQTGSEKWYGVETVAIMLPNASEFFGRSTASYTRVVSRCPLSAGASLARRITCDGSRESCRTQRRAF